MCFFQVFVDRAWVQGSHPLGINYAPFIFYFQPSPQDIKYQMNLDMYEFCTPELQQKLLVARNNFKEVEEKKSVRKISKWFLFCSCCSC